MCHVKTHTLLFCVMLEYRPHYLPHISANWETQKSRSRFSIIYGSSWSSGFGFAQYTFYFAQPLKNHLQHDQSFRGYHSVGSRRQIHQAEIMYSRTSLIRINWDDEPSGYTKSPDNWIFCENTLHWQF